jgi:hypothetical protein
MEDDFLTDDMESLGITMEPVNIDVDEINNDSTKTANIIIERLSNYFFDEEYIKSHPYIPTKIKEETENVRRLLKMLTINETAQDILIKGLALDPSKAGLYTALTSMQNSTLQIQKQLMDRTDALEEIFKKMEDETERSFKDKPKDNVNGLRVVRGSKDFLKKLQKVNEA